MFGRRFAGSGVRLQAGWFRGKYDRIRSMGNRGFLSLALAVLSLPSFAAGAGVSAVRFSVSVTHPDGVYAAGEVVPMTVTVADTNGVPVSAGSVTAVLDNYGRKEFARRTVDLSKENPFVVKATRPTPGAVRLTLSAAGTKPASWGVMFSPERIRTGSPKPSDFDAFWREAKARYDREVPVDVKLERLDGFCTAARTVSRLSLTTPHGRTVDGVLTEPADLSAGPFPVRINVPGAGPSYGLSWGGGKDRIGLVMNVHYYPLVPGQHEHSQSNAELRALWKAETDEYRRKYGARIYWLAGAAAGREDFHYYDCILAISRAIDWLWTRPEAKKDDFRYSGVSQGGGMGLILSGFNTHITRTAVYVPALTDMLGFLDGKRQSGWPQITENLPSEQREAILANIPYFDAAHFASRIRTPIRIAVGLSDPACPPAAVWAGFNAIPADDKGIVPGFGMTHSPYPEIRKELDVWLNE